MTKTIEPLTKKIGDYLKLDENTIFIIPEYQRPYSWGITNCDKLWQDLLNYDESSNPDNYFFGTIIINCLDNDSKYELIDGQQRTTTFFLLLKAFLMRINTTILAMPKDSESNPLLQGLKGRRRSIMEILYKAETENISDIPDATSDSTIYNSLNLLENHSINEQYKNELDIILKSSNYVEAENKVYKIPRKQKDNKYTNYFRNFKYFYDKVSDLSESNLNSLAKILIAKCEVIRIRSWNVGQAIKMFNSLNSDGLPLLDSDIISAQLYAEAARLNCESDFAKKWKELKGQIDELETLGIADIDSILMQQMYIERASNGDTITESGTANVTTPGLRRYYIEINTPLLSQPIVLCEKFIKLASIWKKVSSYPIAKILFKFNENTKFFLASYFVRFEASDITEEKVYGIFECLLRLFTILEVVDTGYSSAKFKSFLFLEEIKMIDNNIPYETIKADFSKHIADNWSDTDIEGIISEYKGNALVYLNEFLYAKGINQTFDLGTNYDIEHIMPSSGADLQTIRRDANIADEKEFEDTVNLIGNKIVLEDKINRGIGNEWFRTKVSTKLVDKTGYVDSICPIAKALVDKYKNDSKPFWTKTDIETATEKASKRITNFIFDKKNQNEKNNND